MTDRVYYVAASVDIDGVATMVCYTDDVAHAANFVPYVGGDRVESTCAYDVFIDYDADISDADAPILYERRQRYQDAYDKPGADPGTFRRDVTHDVAEAANFYRGDDGSYWEMV